MQSARLAQGSKFALLLLRSTQRHMSQAAVALTSTQVNEQTGVATLSLNRPPLNGLNLEMVYKIRDSVKEIESNKSRGLILTSSNDGMLSAGLDIMEMYKPNKERLNSFGAALQDMWLTLFGSGLPTAAAINGHSFAGGSLLALSCEYRVMLPNFTIGFNETQLGIVAPEWWMNTLLNVVQRRVAEMALTQGRMFTTDEALKIGLVDAVAADKTEALALCEQFISKFAKVNPLARALTKQQFRAGALQQLRNDRKKDLDAFVNFVNLPAVQKVLGVYIEAMKNKGKQ